MGHSDLQGFLRVIEEGGDLKRVKELVDPHLEITEIADRVCRARGPAILFENVRGGRMPVLVNAFGSMRRIGLALNATDLDPLGTEVAAFLAAEAPGGQFERGEPAPGLERLKASYPRLVQGAACQEVVYMEGDADLRRLPVPHCWPRDGGPAITLPVVFTRHPETGVRNAGMYRMQVFDGRTTGMHWYPQSGGAAHYRAAERMGRPLDVAVAIGPDPAMTYAATAPLPDGVDEVAFAGFLRQEPVELARCLTVDLEVPASSQIVIEGHVPPGIRRMEGPFGNHTGYYSPAGEYPVFHVRCMTHRSDAVYPTTVVGRPPQEDCYIAKATERLFLPTIRAALPEIVDINLPIEGIFHNLAFVSMDKQYPGQTRRVINALWGHRRMLFYKILCIFDKEVDVQDLSQVLWRLGTNVDPRRDCVFADGPVDALNHASPLPLYGSKMAIDCTRKWPEEGFGRPWPEEAEMDPCVREKVDRLWPKLGLKTP